MNPELYIFAQQIILRAYANLMTPPNQKWCKHFHLLGARCRCDHSKFNK